MFKRIVPLMMVSYLAWQWTTWYRQRQQRSAPAPAEETRWEGEGGALPVTGSQVGPEPATSP